METSIAKRNFRKPFKSNPFPNFENGFYSMIPPYEPFQESCPSSLKRLFPPVAALQSRILHPRDLSLNVLLAQAIQIQAMPRILLPKRIIRWTHAFISPTGNLIWNHNLVPDWCFLGGWWCSLEKCACTLKFVNCIGEGRESQKVAF